MCYITSNPLYLFFFDVTNKHTHRHVLTHIEKRRGRRRGEEEGDPPFH